MAIDFNSMMNQKMRDMTARTRMQAPSQASVQAGPPTAQQMAQEARLETPPPPNIGMRPPQAIQTTPTGWQPPAGLMSPQVTQRQPSPPPPSRPPGQPMPQRPGQMGATPPAAPGMPQPPGYRIQPPGVAARPEDYAYEPQPDKTWKMYPPGVASPPHGYQVSMPKAASTRQLSQMSQELGRFMNQREQMRQSTQPPAPPGFANPNEVQGY